MQALLWRLRFIIGALGAFLLPLILFLKYRDPILERMPTGKQPLGFQNHPIPETDPPGIYDWNTTSSAFDPVNLSDADDLSLESLCASFPTKLLDRIQPVLKTGHGMLQERLAPQMRGSAACLDGLVIFSDFDESFQDRHVYDVIRTIPDYLTGPAEQLQPWRDMNAFADNNTLFALTAKKGWRLDKYKFLAGVSRVWEMRPEREWYVFFEDDTLIIWDNLFRLLDGHFDPDEPLYYGSPSPGRADTWFANGGPGYIISRGAMRRLVAEDHDSQNGSFLGSRLSEKEWYWVTTDCCGDSVLGWALAQRDVFLSGLYPLFNPQSPHSMPFSDRYWCQPLMTMHKPHAEDLEALFRWETKRREANRPLLHRDLALTFLEINTLDIKTDWDNGALDTFSPPTLPNRDYTIDPHASVSACESACRAHEPCFQWRYHLRECIFGHVFRLGQTRLPSMPPDEPPPRRVNGERVGIEEGGVWTREDLRFTSGWDTEKIQRWADQRPCEEVRWVKPSSKRII